MDRESSAFDLGPDELVRLWDIGSDLGEGTETPEENQRKAELLHDWLASPLPVGSDVLQLLPAILSRLCQELEPFTGQSLGSLLVEPSTDIDTLKKIKDISKTVVQRARTETASEAATAVYYGAIAAALLFHAQKITSFSYRSLQESFAVLSESGWVHPDLIQLLGQALEVCQQKTKDKQ